MTPPPPHPSRSGRVVERVEEQGGSWIVASDIGLFSSASPSCLPCILAGPRPGVAGWRPQANKAEEGAAVQPFPPQR